MYLKRGLKIMRIRADLEFSAIQVLVNKLPTRPVMILAAQGEHVEPIEQNIRYSKGKIRSLRYMLPFERVPKNIIEALLYPSVEDFGRIIGSGAIRGCKLTTEDANISFKIFGPSVVKDKGN